MTSIFPENKEDFTAPNGITYTWVENRWRTKTFDNNEYLPLSGGTMAGDIVMNGKKITGLGSATQGGMAVSRNFADERYLPKADPYVNGQLTVVPTEWMQQSKFRTTNDDGSYFILKPSATSDRSEVEYWGLTTSEHHIATVGYVDNAVADSVGGLSPREKMYLQGFYPFVVSESSQPLEGEITFKDYQYLKTLDMDKWKNIEYGVVDAYGQDLAGTFMNHMDTRNVANSDRKAQVWFARENGRKLISFYGPIGLSDNNFESRQSMKFETGTQQINSPNYDTESKRVDYGEILWIKCSYWGN